MFAVGWFPLVSVTVGLAAVTFAALNFYFQYLRRRSGLLVKCLHASEAPGHTATTLALCNTGNTQVMVSHVSFSLRAPEGDMTQEITTAVDAGKLPVVLNPGEIRSLLAWTNQPLEWADERFARAVADAQGRVLREFEILLNVACIAVNGATSSICEHFGTRCYCGSHFVRGTGRSFTVEVFGSPRRAPRSAGEAGNQETRKKTDGDEFRSQKAGNSERATFRSRIDS